MVNNDISKVRKNKFLWMKGRKDMGSAKFLDEFQVGPVISLNYQTICFSISGTLHPVTLKCFFQPLSPSHY